MRRTLKWMAFGLAAAAVSMGGNLSTASAQSLGSGSGSATGGTSFMPGPTNGLNTDSTGAPTGTTPGGLSSPGGVPDPTLAPPRNANGLPDVTFPSMMPIQSGNTRVPSLGVPQLQTPSSTRGGGNAYGSPGLDRYNIGSSTNGGSGYGTPNSTGGATQP